MNIVTLDEESKRQGGFYIPSFEIRIEGVGLPQDVLRDVLQVTYTDDIKKFDSFELVVNNWDASTNSFKYIGAETKQSMQENPFHRLFLSELCRNKVKILMGYLGDLRVMATGHFTAIEPSFTSSSAPTLTVRGFNVLHQLRRGQHTTPWSKKRDSDIAEEIGKAHDDKGKRRFPIPIEIDKAAKKKEPVLERLTQNNQYDIDFLRERAKERGYVLFIQEEDPKVRGSKSRLYFGPSNGIVPGLRDVTFKLEWGKSLIDFKPTINIGNQIQSVTVHHWDRRMCRLIKKTVTFKDFACNRDLEGLFESCEREEIVTDERFFSGEQAQKRALAILNERQKELITVKATTIGLPDLRAGQRVQIEGLGMHLNGKYFITDTKHTIGDDGYKTEFGARRENCNEGDKA